MVKWTYSALKFPQNKTNNVIRSEKRKGRKGEREGRN